MWDVVHLIVAILTSISFLLIVNINIEPEEHAFHEKGQTQVFFRITPAKSLEKMLTGPKNQKPC